MSLTKINKKRAEAKAKKINLVKTILKENPNLTKKEIQNKLKPFGVNVSFSSIKRYKKQIPKNKSPTPKPKSQAPKLKSPTPKQKSQAPKAKFPYFVYCPGCKVKCKITSNPVQSVGCHRCGFQYDRANKKWVPTKAKRRNSKLFFDY